MRPLRLRLKGITRYSTELALDLSEIPPGLCAIVGGNGEGKSTLLGCMAPTPTYLKVPGYPGKLADSCDPEIRDCVIELEQEYAGSTWRHLIEIDPQARSGAGKAEMYLYRGKESLTDRLKGDYLEAIEQYFPPSNVFFAAAFSVQTGDGNWFELSKVERRDLFGRLLGLGNLQALAERATKHRKHADAMVARIDDRVGDLEAAASEKTEVEKEIPDLIEAERLKAAALTDSSKRKATAMEELGASRARAKKHRDKFDGAIQQRADLRRRSEEASSTARDLAARMTKLQSLVDDEDSIRARARERERLTARLTEIKADWTEKNSEIERMRSQSSDLTGRLKPLRRDLERLKGDEERLGKLRARETELEVEIAEAAEVEEKLAEISFDADALRQAEERVETAKENVREKERAADVAVKDHQEARRRAALLEDVPCSGRVLFTSDGGGFTSPEEVNCADCNFLTEANLASDSIKALEVEITERAAEQSEAEAAVKLAEKLLVRLREDRDKAAHYEKRKAELQHAPASLAELRETISGIEAQTGRAEEIEAEITEVEEKIGKLESDIEAATKDLQSLRTDGDEINVQVEAHADALGKEAELERALGELPSVKERVAENRRRADELKDQAEAIEIPDEDEILRLEQEVRKAEREAESRTEDETQATTAATTATEALANARGRLEQLEKMLAEAKKLSTRRTAIDDQRAGWVLLEKALGRDGLQALEIDAAGPEVSEIMNDLLAACFGRRFTCSLRTVQEAGAGRKQKEVFDLDVLDGKRGGPARAAERFSEGEKVLISEAMKLALAIFNARRQPIPILTLWRDECDGALEPALAAAYPSMLRSAMELGGYERIYLISHNEAVWSQADTAIYVADGRARVADPSEVAELMRKKARNE